MLIPDVRTYSDVSRSIGSDPINPVSAGASEVLAAAMATENTLGSLMVKRFGLPDGYIDDPDFNPFPLLSDQEKNDPLFSDNAMLADTVEELELFRKQYAMETKNRETLRNAGGMGALAMLAAGVFDPVNLIPVGGAAWRTYRSGDSILKGAMVTASVAVGLTAATEGALHATQLQRTYGESALNMSAALLLGGALGAGAAKLSNKKLLSEIEESLNVEPKITAGEDSVGAMRVVDDVQISGKVARGLAKVLGWDPLSRTLLSKNPVTRSLSAKMAESPYDLDGNSITAIESVVKVKTGEHYNVSFMDHLDAYKAYRKDGGNLGRRKFNELVSREQRDPGSVDNPFVKKSAASWEKNTYEPLRSEAIEAKLLPDDVTPKNAAQYLNRQWLPEKVAANLPLFLDKTVAWLKTQNIVDDIDLEDLAGQIASRITSSRDGMLPYDYDVMTEALKPSRGAKEGLSSSFKPLTFQVNSRNFEEFIENDIETLGRNYVRRTVPDIEFSKAFDSDISMKSSISDMHKWYLDRIKEAKTEKERIALGKQSRKDRRDLEVMNERIRGVFNNRSGVMTDIDPNDMFGRIMKVSRDLNYMRLMGGVVPASLSDMARTFMSEGIIKTFSQGLIPLARNVKNFRVAAKEAKAWGIGDDMITGHRVDVLADISDYTRGQSVFERGLHSAAQGFSKINLMNQWTSGMKQLQAVVMQNQIVPGMINGKIDKRLVRLGISEADQRNIGVELKRTAKKIDGIWIANVSEFQSPDLAMLYKTAMRKESDRVIVVSGQEKPIFMSTEMGKTMLQFRSFMMSATQRILISGIQGQDANFMSGIMSMVSFGMMTYAFKQWDAGRPLSDDPAVWVIEGLDRSGATGSIMEINNTLERISNNSIGMRPLLGISTYASRFASRNAAESVLGPSFGGLLTGTLRVGGTALKTDDIKDSDIRAIRRMLPYQNLAIMRQFFDQVEGSIEEAVQ